MTLQYKTTLYGTDTCYKLKLLGNMSQLSNCVCFSVLSRIVRVTDKVLEYRYWISVNFQAPASPCHLLPAEDMPIPEQLTCTPAAVLSLSDAPSTAPSGKSYARAAASSLTKRFVSPKTCQYLAVNSILF